jgi:hypothetical protein
MNSKSVDWVSFGKFMQDVQEARDGFGLRSHQECFFRGHGDSGFQLKPSLFRDAGRSEHQTQKVEGRSFFSFQAQARQLYESEMSGWDVLFHMQHHGVPTRLLDWTSVFGVALYFAILNVDAESACTPCVWLLNPYALNHATWGLHRLFNPTYLARIEDLNRSYDFSELLLGAHRDWKEKRFGWQTPLAIYSVQRSERMFAQSGWFTIHGTDVRSIEDIFPNCPDILRRVEIPRKIIPTVHEYLAGTGIGHRTLFPDLDGLARSICEKFQLGRQSRSI